MTGATTLAGIRIEDRVLHLADRMIDDAMHNRSRADVVMLFRREGERIVARTVLVLHLVDRMIDDATHNHSQADVETLAHLKVDQVVGLTVLDLRLVGQMIDDVTSNRHKVDVADSDRPPVARAVTLARRSAARVMIVVVSFHRTVAIEVGWLRNMAVVTIEDAVTSVRRSVDRVTTEATWDLHQVIVAAVPIVGQATLSRLTAVPIEDGVTSVRRCKDQAASAATSAHLRVVVMIVVAMVAVRNRRCGTPSRSSAGDWSFDGLS